jgi:HlyD family secretion protein
MTAHLRRLVFWGIPVLALVLALAFAFRPRPIDVDLSPVVLGPLVATVAEEGETRIKDIFVLSAPIRGRALRVEIEEGDEVVARETVVAEIEPIDPAFLDVRTEAEARAAINTANAALALATAGLAEAHAELEFVAADLERMRTLRASNTISARALDEAERSFKTREAAVATAEAALAMRQSELAGAKIPLLAPREARTRSGTCPCIPIHAPVSGRVLRVLHESEGVVEAGEPLVEIGNPGELEIVVDFLSSDAVRIKSGQRVIIEEWGGDEALQGRVAKVEPYGFTKISALGIEEQRVNVIIYFTDPPQRWNQLGHGFQVEVRVVLWEDAAALKVPLTALFRDGGGWMVFVVDEARARAQPVVVGHEADFEAEIVSGVSEGDVVIRYPNNHVTEGAAVRQR